jgi:hypothetical protein
MRARVANPLDAVDVPDGAEELVEQRPDAIPAARLARGKREVTAVAVHVLAQQRHLGDAVVGRPADLLDDVVEGPADLLATHGGHDAERTAVVAADLDGHPPGPRHLAPHRERGGEGVEVLRDGLLEDLHDRAASDLRLVEELGGPVHVVGAEHHIDVRGPVDDRGPVLLGQTAGHRDLHAGLAVLQRLEVPEGAVELVVGVLPDAARVQDDDVGVLGAGGLLQAVGLEEAGDPLRVVLVHLAPEGAQEEATGLGHGGQATDAPREASIGF